MLVLVTVVALLVVAGVVDAAIRAQAERATRVRHRLDHLAEEFAPFAPPRPPNNRARKP